MRGGWGAGVWGGWWCSGCGRCCRCCRCAGQVGNGYAAFVPDVVRAHEQFYGHGIEYFVADDYALHGWGQLGVPLHQVAKACQSLLLALAQAARDVYYGVLARCCALGGQGVEYLLCQCAAACAKFPDGVGLGVVQGLLHLRGECLPKQGADFGGGYEVAAVTRQMPEFGAAVGVVAQMGGV